MAIKEQAEQVAQQTQPVGIAIEVIAVVAEYLIPALIKCWIANNTSGEVSGTPAESAAMMESLEDHYDPVGRTFDQATIDRIRPRTRRAARRAGQTRLGRGQLDAITVSALVKARSTALPTVYACMAEAIASPDDNDGPEPIFDDKDN